MLHWKTIAALLQRPWWERVWVPQEIAVAQSIRFHCGDSTCTFQDIGASVEHLTNLVNQLGFEPHQQKATQSGGHGNAAGPFKVSPFEQADLLHRLKYRMGNHDEYIDLKNLIFHTRSCKATDLRDKIFSVLSLTDPEIYELQPDYRLSVYETFVAATHSLLSKTRSLDFFSACRNPERLNGLPSWVPNLLDSWRAWPFEPVHQLHQVSPKEEAEYTFDEDSAILRVTGSYLDSIDATSTGTVSQDDTFEELNALFHSWKIFAQDALSRTDIEYTEQRYISEDLLGLEKERSWIELLSVGHDRGHSLRYSPQGELLPEEASPLDRTPEVRFARSLLLPGDLKTRGHAYIGIHNYLRKFGVGRRLGLSKTGIIGLVPADAQQGDEICLLNGASFPYLLRKTSEHHVIVREACKLAFVFYPSSRPTTRGQDRYSHRVLSSTQIRYG